MNVNLPVSDLNNVLTGPEAEATQKMIQRLQDKLPRHELRQSYYDGANRLKSLGIAIPPHLSNLEAALGWPSIAVDSLRQRVRFSGFIVPGDTEDSFGIEQIVRENNLDMEALQAHSSALLHATAFLLVTAGDTSRGEPAANIRALSAMEATGLWDPSRRALGAGLVVLESDTVGVTRFVVLFDHKIVEFFKEDNRWFSKTVEHGLGEVPLYPLAYRPRLGRPFGSSRLTRAAMNLTDQAMRSVIRAEIGMEIASVPQRYLLGAEESQFTNANGEGLTGWQAMIGALLAIPTNEETNETPTVGQFAQMQAQPHVDFIRQLASLFSAETYVPVSMLGVAKDMPSSAEAINAQSTPLVLEAEYAQAGFAPAWIRAMKTAVRIRGNLREVPEELNNLYMRWFDPSAPSRHQSVQSVRSEIEAGLISPRSEVALRRAGYSEAEIRTVQAEERLSEGADLIAALVQGGTGEQGPGEYENIRERADALGVLIRAGVDPDEAAERVGLPNIKFTGAIPTTLRPVESQARVLEDR